MLILALLACGALAPIPAGGAPAVGLTYENTGQPFALTYCVACHSSHLEGEQRRGAPAGVDLDSLAGLRQWADRARHRATITGDMPPGGGPSMTELQRFGDWLAAGAPGALHPLPIGGGADPALVQGYVTVVGVSAAGDDLVVTRTVDGPQTDFRSGLFSTETYRLTASTAALVSLSDVDADGQIVAAAAFEPPLTLIGPAAEAPQPLQVDRGAEGIFDEEWTVAVGEAVADPRCADPAATPLEASSDQGEVQTWFVSDAWGLAGRLRQNPDGSATAAFRMTADGFPLPPLIFPLLAGDGWVERVLLTEGE